MTKQMKNPCWSGYEAYGFKEKDGRRVPNCIPTKSFSSLEMPYKLERWGDKAIVVNSMTGKHYSSSPIPVVDATKQMRILEAYKRDKEALRSYGKEKEKLRLKN